MLDFSMESTNKYFILKIFLSLRREGMESMEEFPSTERGLRER